MERLAECYSNNITHKKWREKLLNHIRLSEMSEYVGYHFKSNCRWSLASATLDIEIVLSIQAFLKALNVVKWVQSKYWFACQMVTLIDGIFLESMKFSDELFSYYENMAENIDCPAFRFEWSKSSLTIKLRTNILTEMVRNSNTKPNRIENKHLNRCKAENQLFERSASITSNTPRPHHIHRTVYAWRSVECHQAQTNQTVIVQIIGEKCCFTRMNVVPCANISANKYCMLVCQPA